MDNETLRAMQGELEYRMRGWGYFPQAPATHADLFNLARLLTQVIGQLQAVNALQLESPQSAQVTVRQESEGESDGPRRRTGKRQGIPSGDLRAAR